MSIGLSLRRTLVIIGCGLILLQIIAQLNHAIAPARMYVWIGGLLITFAGLRLPAQEGFNACFVLGLFMDATSPTPFGLLAFLFGIAHLILVRVRHRVAGDETLVALMIALLVNLALFVALTFTRLADLANAAATGVRLLADLVISQAVLALAAPWYFALQGRALEFVGAGLRGPTSEPI
ncbi:MAG TPA: hypothetical protein VHF69_05510 [Candidatus Synoicihabitans sp.]|nr:hypothetical protein [Candidatus Synoicihabitans sp.]